MISLRRIADEAGVGLETVRNVLKEVPGAKVAKSIADKVFNAARKLGYDLKKLKIGKRLQYRKETLDEIINRIADNAGWGRAEIVKYLKDALTMVERVHKRAFKEEYGDDWL